MKINLGCLGLEPRTIRLKAEYSTIELAALVKYYHERKKIERYKGMNFKKFFKFLNLNI